MKIHIHEEAIKNFNDRANKLLYKLLPKPKRNHKLIDSYKSDTPSHTLDQRIFIGDTYLSTLDISGKTIERFFKHENQFIGLSEESHYEFLKLVDLINSKKELKKLVSKKFLYEKIFNWMKERYKGHNNVDLTDYLINETEKAIKKYNIWIPIASTEIESPLKFGAVTIRELTKDIINKSYMKIIKQKGESKKEIINQTYDEIIEKHQGRAIANLEITAEKYRAEEIAFEKSEQAISLLRYFHKASFYPEAISNSTLFGMKTPKSKHYFIFKDEIITHIGSGFKMPFDIWVIGDDFIKKIKPLGFDILSNLLVINRNNFQNKLFDSLIMYSKCSLADSLSDKLTAIIVALESIIIKNENEPIQQNIADRVAFSISDKTSERQKIVKIVKDTYSLRSKFLHHGHKVDDIKIFSEFMLIVWSFFNFLIFLSQNQNIDSKENLIDYIEKRKYSSGNL